MAKLRFSRRRLLLGLGLGLPAAALADAAKVEPGWLQVRTLRLAKAAPRHRFVHFTDIHFKGDVDYLRRVVATINGLKPDFACFTGDLIEEARHFAVAVEELAKLTCPLYAIPGNHDHWSEVDLGPLAELCRKTGGDWLVDRQVKLAGTGTVVSGVDRMNRLPTPILGATNILLLHYPGWADTLPHQGWDLILSGHTHGGQVRLPFIGALITPFDSGRYEMGLYDTPSGPMYVSAGIGEFYFRIRFRCRPEITVVEI
jgi:predicted MPP superfamily phosphohydrolase